MIDDESGPGGTVPPEDAEIVEGEIVDDIPADPSPDDEPGPLLDQDIILAPCHHGCTCGLHVQVTYGSRVEKHPPDVLDHGEMGLLTEAAERATRCADDYHAYLARHRELTEQAHGRASKSLTEFEVLLASRCARGAERAELAEQRAALPPSLREPAPRWLKAIAIASAVAIAIFDAYFFQQAFLNILQITQGDAWWRRDIGVIAALVFAVGIITAGRMLSGPIWRLSCRWQRPPAQTTSRPADSLSCPGR